jgi:hypothetical protein
MKWGYIFPDPMPASGENRHPGRPASLKGEAPRAGEPGAWSFMLAAELSDIERVLGLEVDERKEKIP